FLPVSAPTAYTPVPSTPPKVPASSSASVPPPILLIPSTPVFPSYRVLVMNRRNHFRASAELCNPFFQISCFSSISYSKLSSGHCHGLPLSCLWRNLISFRYTCIRRETLHYEHASWRDS